MCISEVGPYKLFETEIRIRSGNRYGQLYTKELWDLYGMTFFNLYKALSKEIKMELLGRTTDRLEFNRVFIPRVLTRDHMLSFEEHVASRRASSGRHRSRLAEYNSTRNGLEIAARREARETPETFVARNEFDEFITNDTNAIEMLDPTQPFL